MFTEIAQEDALMENCLDKEDTKDLILVRLKIIILGEYILTIFIIPHVACCRRYCFLIHPSVNHVFCKHNLS